MVPRRILLIGGQPDLTVQLGGLVRDQQCLLETASGQDALEKAATTHPDLVLLDLNLPDTDTLRILQGLRSICPVAAVIALSDGEDPHLIAEAIHHGAQDCYAGTACLSALYAAIEAYLSELRKAPGQEMERGWAVEEIGSDGYFVTVSPVMRRLRAELGQLAPIDTSVLCLGESGTGKEVVARLIHALSPRASRTFLKVNCAALPGELLESELFGYQRGAFTGAAHSKPGRLELCNGGSVLLDEIGEIAPSLQAKLLHFLQDHQFTRLGGCTKVRVNVRVLAATNIDMRKALHEKRFREDLYYRLSTFVVRVPPLRERPEDIPILLKEFLHHYAAEYGIPERPCSRALIDECCTYLWPGNVRELQSFAQRYLVLGEGTGPGLNPDSGFPVTMHEQDAEREVSGNLKSRVRDLKDLAERSAISGALERAHWNRREAARSLNISYKSILGKIRQYGLDRRSDQTAVLPEPNELVHTACAMMRTPAAHQATSGMSGQFAVAEAGCPK